MTSPAADLVAADLAKLINPGLRSPRAGLAVLPDLALVQADIHGGARSVADAIESVVNRGLTAMAAGSPDARLPRLAADPVKALRAALALRPGSERVKSKTRRTAAAQALGLLSGDGWRAHHEKPLLRDLADAICALEADSGDVVHLDGATAPGAGAAGIGPPRHVEVYLTTAMFRHAIYLFTHRGILALYALCSERIPTPALLASDGGLLSFMRLDFDRLLEQSDRIT